MLTKLIVGLGNPLPEFEATYHNVGMLAVEHLAEELSRGGTPLTFKPHRGLFRYAITDKFALVLPLTFMNESGAAVKEAVKKFGIPLERLVIVHDESDLTLGNYTISFDRNSAGHNGVQSIINTLGSKAFSRARIGIRPAEEKKRKKASAFVLTKISAKDKKALREVFSKIAKDLTA